jgi:hypothetical protein
VSPTVTKATFCTTLPFRIELPPTERKSITPKESSQHNNFTFYIRLGPDDGEEVRFEGW